MGRRWYVVRTRPRSESLAADKLEQSGYQIFSPVVVHPPEKDRRGFSPLFPGYLFIRLDQPSNISNLHSNEFPILGILNFGGEAAWLADSVIENIRIKCEQLNRDTNTWTRYTPGDWVQVVSPAIQGIGEVVSGGKTAQARVKVLMELFERIVPVSVSRVDLRPFEGPLQTKTTAPRRTRGRGRWIRGFGSRSSSTV